MPQAVGAAILWAIGESAVASATIASVSVAEIVGTVAITAATIGLNAALAPSTPDPQSGKQQVKQSVPYACFGYGRARIAGAVMLDEAAGQLLERVFAVAQGQIDGYEQWYLNDDKVRLVAGVVQSLDDGSYPDSRVQIQSRLGLPTETAYAALASELPQAWSASARGDGIASYYIRCRNGKLQDFPKQFPNGKPQPSVSARLLLVWDWRDATQHQNDPTSWKWSDNPVICWVNDLWRVWGYDWARCFAPTLDNSTAQADICDELVPVKTVVTTLGADADSGDSVVLLNSVNGLAAGWSFVLAPNADTQETRTVSSISGSGAPYSVTLTAPLSYDHKLYEHVKWSANPAAPPMEKRYTVNGFYQANVALSDVILQFRTCCDGWMCRNGEGAVVIKVGRFEQPTVTITGSDIVDYSWSSFVVDEQACNQLNVSFCAPQFDYSQVDTDPWSDETDIDARGTTRAQAFYPQWCQYNSQARRLAKRQLWRLLAGSGTIRTLLSGMPAIGERYIRVQAGPDDIDELNDVVVEITGDPEIAEDGLSIIFTVTAASPVIDEWDYLTEEGDGPNTVDRLSAVSLTAPIITSVTPVFSGSGSGGTQGVRLILDATGPDRDDLSWQLRWRIAGDTDWTESSYPSITSHPNVAIRTEFVPADASLEVEAGYVTGAGASGPWSLLWTVSTSTASVPPAAPGSLSVSVSGTTATVLWRNPTSAVLAGSRVWRAGHGVAFASATDVSGLRIGGLGATDSFADTGLASGAYDYWVTAENAGGARSGPAGPVTATIP